MSDESRDRPIFLFDRAETLLEWQSVNDAVMGGLSRGEARWSGRESMLFAGSVSLANNGGFASIRSATGLYDLSGRTGIVLQIRGDGRRYKLNIRTDPSFDGISWQSGFAAPSRWAEAFLPLEDFLPTYHGMEADPAGPMERDAVRSFGFLIAEGQEGPFQLEIAAVSAR